MASHQLAIAKASFTASLLRPDPTSVSRDEISHFHTLVNSVASQCSPTNIQICKRWILVNVIPSAGRFNALGKYLIALSTSFSGPAKPSTSATSHREPSGRRKRLHLLYLINDLLYHAKFHVNDASVASKVQPLLIGLFSSAASFKSSPKQNRKIEELLDIWEEMKYYSTDYTEKLREGVKIAHDSEQCSDATKSSARNGDVGIESKPPRTIPFVMPAIHGDQGTPWYDLPAGNLMPHITPNSTRPINATLVKPLRFVAGPADEKVATAVKNLLQEVNSIFGVTQLQDQHESVPWDIDELGQGILQDDATGEALSEEGYYGWSKAFCEKMKKRRKGLDRDLVGGHDERRGRSQSSSQSSQRNRSRRLSSSDGDRSRSRSNSRTRHGRHAHSSSRSHSRNRSIAGQRNKRSRISHESFSRSTSEERDGRNTTGAAYRPQFGSLGFLPDAEREPFVEDSQPLATLQQTFLLPPSHHFGLGLTPPPPPPPPQYGQWRPQPPLPPSTAPYTQQLQPAGSWPPQPPPFIPHWTPSPYGQTPIGPPHPGSNGRGGYGVGNPQQQQQQQQPGAGSGYNAQRGSGRGNNGWS